MNLGQFEDEPPSKQDRNLKFLEKEYTKRNSKSALRAGTACNKYLRYTLQILVQS